MDIWQKVCTHDEKMKMVFLNLPRVLANPGLFIPCTCHVHPRKKKIDFENFMTNRIVKEMLGI